MTRISNAPITKIAPKSNAANDFGVGVLIGSLDFVGSLFKSYMLITLLKKRIGAESRLLPRSAKLICVQLAVVAVTEQGF